MTKGADGIKPSSILYRHDAGMQYVWKIKLKIFSSEALAFAPNMTINILH